MSNRYICIHGHFYQPPRENPWLEEVERQDSAYPYHDWNERINAECYARNAASRILNGDGQIVDIVNNYSRISFNFGPTLLEWMEKKEPETYQAILQADKDSQERFSGHGSAISQAYNHMIMPLANERDQQTQVIWGIRDFEKRFGRKPEGMWCGETAVNTLVLEVMAEHGIKFTILSPYQAQRIRKIGEKTWKDVSDGRVNPRQPYLCKLPSGKEIALFFYDGPVSQGIAFEGLLDNGETFANRLLGAFSKDDKPQLMHIATDGESYGHHHKYGEMALSFALHHIDEDSNASLSIYGEFLEKFPPEWEAEIKENTSWSCVHGVERWRSNCGCNTGGHSDWNQEWRSPLRETFDWVRDQLIPIYEQQIQQYGTDPWQLRNDYIDVIYDRSRENVEAFLSNHFQKELQHEDKIKVLKLLELQYHTMLMYTSCGWFFDEVTGIETVQDILYAARAIQLANDLTGTDFEPEFVKMLEKAKSNISKNKDAGNAYHWFVKPTMLDLLRVGAHYAVSSLFSEYPQETRVYTYSAISKHYEVQQAGKQRLAIGRAVLRADITWEEMDLTFAILHLGDHQLFGGVQPYESDEKFELMMTELKEQFEKANTYEVITLIDKHFGAHNYSFWHLFRDIQRQVITQVLNETLDGVESMFKQVYTNNYQTMQALKQVNMTLPNQLKNINDFVVNADLRKALQKEDPDLEELEKGIKASKRFPIELDKVTLEFLTSQRLAALMKDLLGDPENIEKMDRIVTLKKLVEKQGLCNDLWETRNLAFMMRNQQFSQHEEKSNQGDEEAKKWVKHFIKMYDCLNMKI